MYDESSVAVGLSKRRYADMFAHIFHDAAELFQRRGPKGALFLVLHIVDEGRDRQDVAFLNGLEKLLQLPPARRPKLPHVTDVAWLADVVREYDEAGVDVQQPQITDGLPHPLLPVLKVQRMLRVRIRIPVVLGIIEHSQHDGILLVDVGLWPAEFFVGEDVAGEADAELDEHKC